MDIYVVMKCFEEMRYQNVMVYFSYIIFCSISMTQPLEWLLTGC